TPDELSRQSDEQGFEFVHVPSSDFFGSLQPGHKIGCGLEMRQRGGFADELLHFVLTLERLAAPVPAEVAPLNDVEARPAQLVQRAVVFRRAFDRKAADDAAKGGGHVLKPLLNQVSKARE